MATELLTVTQAAKALAIRESTVRDWILRRRIAHTHVGRNVRIPQSAIDRVIESNMVPAETHNARPGEMARRGGPAKAKR